jgi:hypothetical protein
MRGAGGWGRGAQPATGLLREGSIGAQVADRVSRPRPPERECRVFRAEPWDGEQGCEVLMDDGTMRCFFVRGE